jgi:hypothetical protein
MNTHTLKGYKSKLIKYAYLATMERLGKGGGLVLSLALPFELHNEVYKVLLTRNGFLDSIEGLYTTLVYNIPMNSRFV